MNTIMQHRNKVVRALMLLWLPALAIDLSAQNNYIETTTPLDAVSSIQQGGSGRLSIEKNYYDGLGRLQQTVLNAQTPSSNDLVTTMEYDGLSRQSRQWKAVEIEQSSGAYVDNQQFQQAALNFYNDGHPYESYTYEQSAIGRMTSLQKAGDNWQNHTTNYSYGTNISSNVKHITVRDSHTLEYAANYGSGELIVETTTDESGVSSSTYTDKRGKKVAEQTANAWTYYVYNDLGQLAYVLPPLAVDQFTSELLDEDADVMKKYAYVYKYDAYGRLISKRLPGCEEVRMVYNAAGRLILSQDGNQRARGNYWRAFQYDSYGRSLYMAEVLLPAGAEESIRQSQTSAAYNDSYEFYPVNPLEDVGYNTDPFNPSAAKPLVVNYYDTYDFMELMLCGASDSLDFKRVPDFDQRYYSAVGLPTGARIYNLFDDDYSAVTYYYDRDGRVIQQHRKLGLGGYEHTYTSYSFSGQPLRVLTVATQYNTTVRELYEYTYDHADRLLTTTYTLGNDAPVVLQHFTYSADSKIMQKQMYDNIERVEYSYNIQDHITRIQSTEFCENLYYTNIPAPMGTSARLNGTVAAITWTYGNATNGYTFLYDNQNRLTQALGFYNGSNVDYLYTEEFVYDKQGNVTRLIRWDNEDVRDALACTYNGNQLKAVTDNMDAPVGYHDYHYRDLSNSQTEMLYDQNGNLIADSDRNICSIRYNILNLPDTIENTAGEMIVHYYDAVGNRLRTDYRSRNWQMLNPSVSQPGASELPSQFVNTAYAMDGNRRFVQIAADSWQLDYVFNPEGYIRYYGPEEHYRFYYIKDHLGNVRETYVNPAPNDRLCVQRTQYYPSGLPWNEGFIPSEQPFKYNGKELIEMNGLDEYDSEARWYYPAIMRTTTMDPLCEKYYSISPYAWCGNNPVNLVDPDGRVIDESSKKDWKNAKKDIRHKRIEVFAEILNAEERAARADLWKRYRSLSKTLRSMRKLKKSDVIYSLNKTDLATNNTSRGADRDGLVNIIIAYNGYANLVHELTHAYQFEVGDITLAPDGAYGQDVYDEIAAYSAQYGYDPESVKNLPSDCTIQEMTDISVHWIQNLSDEKGNKIYSPGGKCNTGVCPVNINSSAETILRAYEIDKETVELYMERLKKYAR